MLAENFLSGEQPSLKNFLIQVLLGAWLKAGYTPLPFTFYRSKLTTAGLFYRSPLALQIAQGKRSEAIAFATQLLPYLPAEGELGIQVVLTPQGFLDFSFPCSSLSLYLENLPSVLTPYLSNLEGYFTPYPFLWRYVSQRCTNLLHLADREKLIHLSQGDFPCLIAVPNSIPWSGQEALWSEHPQQRELIEKLIVTIDNLPNSTPEKLFPPLVQALLNLERHCRIFGEIALTHRELVQTRLGLLSLGQSLLTWYLKKGGEAIT
jgi:hypothetical protein